MHDLQRLAVADEGGDVLAVIETPRGSPNKVKYDQGLGGFRLSRVLPAGMVFPFDFGFIPRTKGDDGDPLDVVVLLGAAVCTGTIVRCRLVAVIEAEQREHGQYAWERNDRLLAVPVDDPALARLRSVTDVDPRIVRALGDFFVRYNELDGRGFRVLRTRGSRTAARVLREARADPPDSAT
jgi:inorganic pyrophosphatase